MIREECIPQFGHSAHLIFLAKLNHPQLQPVLERIKHPNKNLRCFLTCNATT